MKFPCEIDRTRTLKEGMKITLAISEDEVAGVHQHIHKFLNKDLVVDMQIDAEAEQEKLGQITEAQRRYIYALLEDFADWQGANKESAKKSLKERYCELREIKSFSLADCKKGLAKDFINFLIRLALEAGVPLSQSPREYYEEQGHLETYMQICLKEKKCCICGSNAEIHHIDSIGMGHDRNKVDDSDKRKIALCREHHQEAHSMGWESFKQKYHVKGVK